MILSDNPGILPSQSLAGLKKKPLNSSRGMKLRTAQFLLYHAKVEGVVRDVSALSNLTDYSDKKFQDASLFSFRWRRPGWDNVFPAWSYHDLQNMHTIFLHVS